MQAIIATFGRFADSPETLIVSSQPRVDTDSNQHRHPERVPQACVAQRNQALPRKRPFSGLTHTWDTPTYEAKAAALRKRAGLPARR
jgi:hypothetical protein